MQVLESEVSSFNTKLYIYLHKKILILTSKHPDYAHFGMKGTDFMIPTYQILYQKENIVSQILYQKENKVSQILNFKKVLLLMLND